MFGKVNVAKSLCIGGALVLVGCSGQLRFGESTSPLRAIWSDSGAQQGLDYILYKKARNNVPLSAEDVEKTKLLYPLSNEQDVREFVEARYAWFQHAGNQFPPRDERGRRELIMYTQLLMKEHLEIIPRGDSSFHRQIVRESYTGTLDLLRGN
ncbi:MAG: hypothetical protein AABX12_04655 [Nanoarchaeota archaeon]